MRNSRGQATAEPSDVRQSCRSNGRVDQSGMGRIVGIESVKNSRYADGERGQSGEVI